MANVPALPLACCLTSLRVCPMRWKVSTTAKLMSSGEISGMICSPLACGAGAYRLPIGMLCNAVVGHFFKIRNVGERCPTERADGFGLRTGHKPFRGDAGIIHVLDNQRGRLVAAVTVGHKRVTH